MEPFRPPQDIAIIGAGIAGIACALSISRELSPFVPNLRITVYERHDILSTSGGAINLTPVAQRHLAQLGVLDELDRMGSEGGADVDAIELFSMRSGRSIGSIKFTDNQGKGFGGYKGRRVMRIALSVAMMTVAERTPNVEIVFGKKVIGGEEFEDRAVVHFLDGTAAVGDLVIGCDGVHSAVRTRFVDVDRPAEYTGLSFLQATIDTATLSSPAHFRTSSLNISRHGSMLASYCDRDCEQIFAAAIVQFSQESLSRHRLLPGQDWATQNKIRCALREEIRDRFGKFPPGGRWCMNRVILLGDAAHAMPPRDESAAYALDDAILFSRILTSYRSEPLTEVFDAYETLRRDTINHAFKESRRMWERNREMGFLEGRIKEWMMTFHLKTNENAREAAWAFDATKMALPTPAPSEDLVSLDSFLRDRTL
ncbi:Monooxygenase FAD-binding [Penicillium expansum]|nr:Monooxygenase FAD-binding [Penicillium expansum]